MFNNSPQNFSTGNNAQKTLPTSRTALIGLAASAVGFFIFGFLGLVGIVIGIRAVLEIRAGKAKGMWIAIAAIVLGTICLLAYLANIFVNGK